MRFAPNNFQYNGRVALALLPSLCVVAGFGGKLPLGVIVVGAMITYILDALRYREGTFGAVWLTLGAANLSLLISGASFSRSRSIPLGIFIAASNGSLLFLTGVWATLQFKWIQMQYPVASLAFEKLLVVGCLPVGGMILTWGVIAATGADSAPYYQALILAGLYYLFGLPLPSSFQARPAAARGERGGGGKGDTSIQTAMDGAVGAALLLLLPSLEYIVIHWHTRFQLVHAWSLLLLSAGPLLFLTGIRDGLWWLPVRGLWKDVLRKVVLLLALAATLAGFEGRVVFQAFGQYIQLHPPWNYIAVTCALYGGAALVVLHLAGLLGEEVGATLLGGALVLSAGAGALAAGIPLLFMPAPLIAAAGLALYYESGMLRDYLLFVGGVVLSAAWFVHHHFWFLEVLLERMALLTICKLLLAAIVPATLLPGLVLAGASKAAIGALLVAQAGLVATLEEHLYAGQHENGSEEMYPAFLVVLTSVVGVAAVHKLRQAQRIGPIASWGAQCMYAAKAAMLVLPEALLAVPVLVLTLAVSPPILLYKETGGRHPRIHPWQVAAHVALIVVAVLIARFALFDVLMYVYGGRPPEGVLLGVLILAMAGGCIPLVSRHLSHSQPAKRALTLAVAAGALLVLLRPPLPVTFGAKCPHLPFGLCPRLWDDAHAPEHEEDDLAMYGEALTRREHWPLWWLATAVMSGLAAATSQAPGPRGVGARLAFAAGSGVCVGTYLALEFFPRQTALQALILAATLLVGAFLVLLQLPTAASPVWLPWMAAVWAFLLPMGYVLQDNLPLPPQPSDALRLYPDSRMQVEDERRLVGRTALLAVYAAESVLLAFALKLRMSAALAGRDERLPARPQPYRGSGAAADRAAGFLGACLPPGMSLVPVDRVAALKGAAGQAIARLSEEGLGWIPTAGNLFTMLCFLLSIWLSRRFTDGSHEAIFVLAPLLLLLNQDPLLFRGMGDRQRYAPVAAAISGYLTVVSALELYDRTFVGPKNLFNAHEKNAFFFVKNLLALLMTLPNHVNFVRYLWSRERVTGSTLLLLTPLNLAAVVLTMIRSIRWLCILAVAAAAVQFFAQRHVRRQGMKLI